MPIEILMPALSPTMTEGNLVKWHVKEGDTVKAGKVIAEIETDKATMEVEAVDEGKVGKILINAGTENVKVNEPIALLLEDGEDAKALASYKPKAAVAPVVEKKQEAKKEEKSENVVAFAPSVTPAVQAPMIATGTGRMIASPLARRVAQQEGVDLRGITGTGPHGRIVKADVEGAGVGGSRAVRRNPAEFTKIPNSNMRKVIAKRLSESKQQVPHFYLTIECVLDKLMHVREDLNADAVAIAGEGNKPAYKLSVNDFVIKAAGLALKRVPAANSAWSDEATLQYNNVDISVAVAIDGGLITPIVKNADQKSVIAISKEMKDLAAKARANALRPEEFQGGSFSISNLGMYGIKHFSAVINPPQGCILAVGAGTERVVAMDGDFGVATVMEVTLSVDHRAVDGAVGAEFLAEFKRYIEHPALLLV